MPSSRAFYIGHPASAYEGDPASLVSQCNLRPELHGGWVLRPRTYDVRASLNARDFCSSVLQNPGPVLLLEPVQRSVIEDVRVRLRGRVPVVVETVGEVVELRAAILRVGESYDQGEPLLPYDVVVALLIMRKLDQERMWAGNSKGYMWADNVRKGRGLDEKYEPRVAHVLNVMIQHGIIEPKTSNSKSKYALNPLRREEIYDCLRKRQLPEAVERILSRNGAVESARALDLLDEYEGVS